ncbi:MAG: hypothetical protein IPN76_12760 [Saprospiraceae bacterium]|nr:hypothetical protein [Saprospiraceae bacterium]
MTRLAKAILNEAIGALGVKKKDFATYIGIEDSNLSAMLKGNRRISPEFALRLATDVARIACHPLCPDFVFLKISLIL